ncbi:MAG: tetratricopeptide repeat protein [Chloroflexota bacterium]|nr:tetratricopeptide repeat protein [Chloroflexota bacterium]
MPGNRVNYEQAMNLGHSAAWEQDWVVAITNYGRAIQEFPDDAEAHLALGFGLLEAGRLEDALKVYTRAHQIMPQDPIPLEKSADILERIGRLKDAASQYVNVADLYLAQRDLNKTIENWERATHLTPGLVAIHVKLAQAYERIGDKAKAVRQYLILAYNFQRLNDLDKAIKSCERALRLERNNTLVLNTKRALEVGNPISMPPDDDARPMQVGSRMDESVAVKKKDRKRSTVQQAVTVEENDPLGPMGEAMTEALKMLATHVVESGMMDASGASALQALEYQRQGLHDEAIAAYKRAEPKLKHPALKLNLGALLVLQDQPDEAIKQLGEAINNSQLAAGAYHALGLAYQKQKKYRQAIKWLIQSLQAVDAAQSLSDDEAVELSTMYERLGAMLERQNDEVSSAISTRLADLLKGKDWKMRVPETRRQLDETRREQGEQGVIDILVAPHGDRLTSLMDAINRHLRQGLTTLAMEEAHYATEFSPFYLPVHERMAEIMLREGRVRQAIAKYNTIASVYMSRGDEDRAAKILTQILEMAPLDLSVRQNLIDLLEAREDAVALVPQYLGLADTYSQLGDADQARETYALAERTAARANSPVATQVQIKHKMADLEQLRTDFRRAQKIYEDIVQISPTDERALRQLIELHYRNGNQVEALKRLDELLRTYAREKNVNRIIVVLEDMVKQHANDMGVRSRLAAIYKQVGRKQDAISQFDALGELQLEAGLHKQAADTIRQIIALNPQNMDDYRRLLGQLGG